MYIFCPEYLLITGKPFKVQVSVSSTPPRPNPATPRPRGIFSPPHGSVRYRSRPRAGRSALAECAALPYYTCCLTARCFQAWLVYPYTPRRTALDPSNGVHGPSPMRTLPTADAACQTDSAGLCADPGRSKVRRHRFAGKIAGSPRRSVCHAPPASTGPLWAIRAGQQSGGLVRSKNKIRVVQSARKQSADSGSLDRAYA